MDVRPADVGEAPAAPRLHHLALEDALVLGRGLGLLVGLGVALDELVDDVLDEVAIAELLSAARAAFFAAAGSPPFATSTSALCASSRADFRSMAG